MHDLYPDEFRWLRPPYEYDYTHMPVDILSGDDRLRKAVETFTLRERIEELAPHDGKDWWEAVDNDLLYPRTERVS